MDSFEELKIDSARGSGEYIQTYATLNKCDRAAQKEIPKLFQKNFTKIYGENLKKSPEQVYESMEKVMKSSSAISSGVLSACA